MGRITKLTCTVCRRLGMTVCGRERCALKRRGTPPGVHGAKSRRVSAGFAFQLQEKQKARYLYGLMERQFRAYVEKATATKGDTGLLLKESLEMRLDNVVYRLGLVKTRAAARQLVNHGHINVNGKRVDISSYHVRPNDVVSVRAEKRESKLFDGVRESLASRETPSWLRFDSAAWSGTVLGKPNTEELRALFDPRPIIEFYSR